MTTSKSIADSTLLSLEERTRRVEYALIGNLDREAEHEATTAASGSAIARLRRLEHTLRIFSSKSPVVSDILAIQNKSPHLFHVVDGGEVPASLSTSSLASLVLAHAKLYQTISAQLPQLQGSTIPDSGAAIKLTELRPRIEQVRANQDRQKTEFAELRLRSAQAVENWYGNGVLGMGENWVQWEERLRNAEIVVRRREAAKKRAENAV